MATYLLWYLWPRISFGFDFKPSHVLEKQIILQHIKKSEKKTKKEVLDLKHVRFNYIANKIHVCISTESERFVAEMIIDASRTHKPCGLATIQPSNHKANVAPSLDQIK